MQTTLIAKQEGTPQHGFLSACNDWFGLGLQLGLRRIEWCQAEGQKDIAKFELNPHGSTYAFTLDNFQFYSQSKKKLNKRVALKNPHLVWHIRVCFDFQKNGDHGELKWITRNIANPELCSVLRAMNICIRFITLRGWEFSHEPLAIYQDSSNKRIYNITDSDANILIRELATETYDISKSEELQLWTCHSIRVGACCILYAMGIPEANIKQLLRWRSDC